MLRGVGLPWGDEPRRPRASLVEERVQNSATLPTSTPPGVSEFARARRGQDLECAIQPRPALQWRWCGVGACGRGRGTRVAVRGAVISDRPRTPGKRMAEPTRAAKPRCRQGALPGAGAAVKPKKKAFYLLSMKPPKDPAPNNNNNVSFVIHCQLGKEIKHICSNCSRGEDGRDGECPARRGGGGKVALPVHRPGAGGICYLDDCGDLCSPQPGPALCRVSREPVGLQQRAKNQL